MFRTFLHFVTVSCLRGVGGNDAGRGGRKAIVDHSRPWKLSWIWDFLVLSHPMLLSSSRKKRPTKKGMIEIWKIKFEKFEAIKHNTSHPLCTVGACTKCPLKMWRKSRKLQTYRIIFILFSVTRKWCYHINNVHSILEKLPLLWGASKPGRRLYWLKCWAASKLWPEKVFEGEPGDCQSFYQSQHWIVHSVALAVLII